MAQLNIRAARGWVLRALAIAAIPVILVFVFLLVAREFQRSEDLTGQLAASHNARAQIAQLLAVHQDIEIGQRSWILTGNDEFREPYEAARPKLEPTLDSIVGLLGRSPEVVRLEELSAAKLEFVERTLALARAGRRDEAIALIRAGEGKEMMDGIRSTIADIRIAEERRLDQRNAAVRSARRSVELAVSAIFIAMSLALLAAIYFTSRAMRLRSDAAQKYRDVSARQVAILDGAHEGVLTVNSSGSIESLNPALAAMSGYRTEELVRRDVGILFEVAPDKGLKESFMRRFLRNSGERGHTFELLGRRKDGTLFPCEVGVSPVRLERETIFVVVVRDVTERKRVEQLKSEFVSTVSHELRTPLTSIAGSLGLVAGGAAGAMPDKATRLIEIARGNCDRLVRLINDILDMEKLESGRMEVSLRPVPLAPFLENAVQANLGYAQEYGIDFELEPVDPAAVVFVDPDLLMQVLANLLSNATKFSPRGQAVSIRALPLDRRWRIDVEDRGSGIPLEFRSRIFGKFAQAEATDSRAKGGTGLGLSIVREIVTRMGGEVSFDSEEGVGTTFHIDLPDHSRPKPAARGAPSQLSVLHVEDDPDVLELVDDSLAGRYNLQSARTLAEARAILDHTGFDIAILDLALPDGSGRDLVPLLRERGSQILVFTAQDSDADLAGEVDALLVKSRSSLPGLVETLDRLLQEKSPSPQEPLT